jgi:hypothetical protein
MLNPPPRVKKALRRYAAQAYDFVLGKALRGLAAIRLLEERRAHQ